MAARLGVKGAATRFEIAPSTLFNAWQRFGIERPSKRLPSTSAPTATGS
jgi:hypothetical protein